MEKINGFTIFKNTKKEKDSQPDYTASVKIGEDYYEFAAGWVKEGKNGKFMAFTCSEPREWEYEGIKKTRPGFEITPVKAKEEKPAEDDIVFPDEEINPDDIPF